MDELNEPLKLLISAFSPLLLVIPIVALLFWTRHEDRKNWSFWKYFRTFDANHGLGSQPLFAMAIVYPVGLFFSTGIWAWSGLSLTLTAVGFNHFIEISQLPLGLLALSIPLAVLTARLHGTKQTALQIEKANVQIANTKNQIIEAQQKNKTDLYLAHYKHFSDHLEALEEKWKRIKNDVLIDNVEISIDTRVLYKSIFPKASLKNGPGSICTDTIDITVESLLDNLETSIESIERVTTVADSNMEVATIGLEEHFDNTCKNLESIFVGLHSSKSLKQLLIPRKIYGNQDTHLFVTCFSHQYQLVDLFHTILNDIYEFDSEHEPTHSNELSRALAKIHKICVNNKLLKSVIISLANQPFQEGENKLKFILRHVKVNDAFYESTNS